MSFKNLTLSSLYHNAFHYITKDYSYTEFQHKKLLVSNKIETNKITEKGYVYIPLYKLANIPYGLDVNNVDEFKFNLINRYSSVEYKTFTKLIKVITGEINDYTELKILDEDYLIGLGYLFKGVSSPVPLLLMYVKVPTIKDTIIINRTELFRFTLFINSDYIEDNVGEKVLSKALKWAMTPDILCNIDILYTNELHHFKLIDEYTGVEEKDINIDIPNTVYEKYFKK